MNPECSFKNGLLWSVPLACLRKKFKWLNSVRGSGNYWHKGYEVSRVGIHALQGFREDFAPHRSPARQPPAGLGLGGMGLSE